MKRVFISVEIPEDIRRKILEVQKEMDKLGLIDGKFTEFENLHLTLKFLGELSDVEIRAIQAQLNSLEFEPFELSLNELGAFSEQFVRIIWVGVEKGEIFNLQKKVDDMLDDLFPSENRFMGHITIARVKKVEQKKMFLTELKKIKFPKFKFKVDKVCLKESKLSQFGAQYQTLLEIPAIKIPITI